MNYFLLSVAFKPNMTNVWGERLAGVHCELQWDLHRGRQPCLLPGSLDHSRKALLKSHFYWIVILTSSQYGDDWHHPDNPDVQENLRKLFSNSFAVLGFGIVKVSSVTLSLDQSRNPRTTRHRPSCTNWF